MTTEIENEWIVMPDGVRLAVSLWLPPGEAQAPAVLEAIPYRKRDSTRAYSRYWGRKLAERGIAYARLDARGSGDSEGLLADEYLPREQQDCAAAIAWLAAQAWCSGAVGMRGVSWGGFITLATAALAPPALKAIMVFCASDRRYTDDAHYVGGSFALTGLKWATSFKCVMAGPPDPAVYGDDWEAAWRARLEATPAIAARWLSRQREDDYWRQGSVFFDPERLRCPAYLVGGALDPYNEMIPRLLPRLAAPAKALIGPWRHGYPQPAAPGPGLEWIDEEVRWWKRWLAGEETGAMDGPRVWAFIAEAAPAEVAGPLPGRWVAEPAWPPATVARRFHLSPGRLGDEPGEGVVELRSDAVVGLATPEWVPFAPPQDPQEQSADDAASLVFDTARLDEPLDILGNPALRLRLAADRPVARLAARLCEVTPDGRSWLIAYAALNLTHRESHAAPTPLEPGRFYDVELPLYLAARRVKAGSRLRLALSEGLWPLTWPSPEPVSLTLDLSAATIVLPVREAATDEARLPTPLVATLAAGRGEPVVVRERGPAAMRFEETTPLGGATLDEIGTAIERSGPDVRCELDPRDPSSCRWLARQSVRYRRGDWDCAVEAEVEVTADAGAFHVRERLVARRGEVETFRREHVSDIARDLM